MKSLNDILWNKDGEIGEEKGKNNEYVLMGQPPMLTDNCGCQYGYQDSPIGGGGFSKGDRWC
ncbi:hypothetical protein [uncultured Tissierella sp.]|uniref:hypothetical protein n=1 Tax=uncultured Tissierella sp. TaxID=448160 RepID=UPI002804B1FF|nr:hypothetical protein [uncultured Tissierella sp.]MDU5082775.1 hypothetical protein [Bacillota bacterium]